MVTHCWCCTYVENAYILVLRYVPALNCFRQTPSVLREGLSYRISVKLRPLEPSKANTL